MSYDIRQALDTLNSYLGISDDQKHIIWDTQNRGFAIELPTGKQVVNTKDNVNNRKVRWINKNIDRSVLSAYEIIYKG